MLNENNLILKGDNNCMPWPPEMFSIPDLCTYESEIDIKFDKLVRKSLGLYLKG